MKTVLIIGASRGIGLELARQYLADGDRVIATVRDDAAQATLKALGAEVLKVDVAKSESVSGLAWQLDGEKIDIAVYVAGVVDRANAHTPPTQPDFDRLMHTNVLGAMQVIPQVAPMVEAAKGGLGKFIFISSGMGQISSVGSSNSWVYRVSKAALNMAVASAQLDYPRAIMVVMNPGWVQTDMGGAGATLTVQDSVVSMRGAITGLVAKHKGQFLNYDGVEMGGW